MDRLFKYYLGKRRKRGEERRREDWIGEEERKGGKDMDC
jgi:hypothetical protein